MSNPGSADSIADVLTRYPVLVDRAGSLEALRAGIAEMQGDERVAGILILAAEENGWTPASLDPVLLETHRAPVFGGIFPGVFHGADLLSKGTVLVGFTDPGLELFIVENLDDLADFQVPPVRSLDVVNLVLGDGLAPGISRLVDEFHFQIGPLATVVGGGTGSGSFRPLPSVVTPLGLRENAAVVCRFEALSAVTTSHGWQVTSEPMKVTRSHGTVVQSINHRPAFEVYREALATQLGHDVDAELFVKVASEFPLGIQRLNQEVIVRDPVAVDPEGAMTFVGEVDEGSFVRLLRGAPSSLLEASRGARARMDETGLKADGSTLLFLLNCVSRAGFLGPMIDDEIAILAGGNSMVGALSLGEIAHEKGFKVEFLNKSTVLARLGSRN